MYKKNEKKNEKGTEKKEHAQYLTTSDTLEHLFRKIKYPPISYQRVLLIKFCNSNEVLWEVRVLELPVLSSLRPIGRSVPIRLLKLTQAGDARHLIEGKSDENR